ncbi:MAG: glycoside hydrolase family 43 protein [Clostridia bacterium]|nr:glycoside hydrolase family 43 protein [Clostridia bacterium]
MFKKFFKALPRIAAIACALLTGASFAACDFGSGGKHTHDYTDAWVQGTTQHWKECSGCDETQGKEDHSYSNGVCTVCQKPQPHTHDFSGAWVQGETRHWKECSGCNEMQGAEGHTYSGGKCSVCQKPDPSAHTEHDFTGAWVQGENKHWKKCSGCELTQGAEGHTYVNGKCSVCKKPEPHTEHDFTGAWVTDENQHWHKCTGCEVTDTKVSHTYTNGVCVCGKADPNAPKKYSFPASVDFGYNVAVHDPSIFKDPKDGIYYAFGSHFAVASSTDLIQWSQLAWDNDSDILYGGSKENWKTVLSQGYAHANNNPGHNLCESTWAPDVEYYNNKYYMYVSLSTFATNHSAIVRVEADNVLGPYGNEQMIVKSTAGVDAVNCIDPELFYDKDGGLWMVYGSFSDGIYIKELHNSGAQWGMPKENGFGTKLWQGISPPDAAQGGPEGPYIFRNGDYYYLMVSDGSLSTNYHMRVARSTSPDGPYVDITGADMATTHGNGNKLAGNWKFDGEQGKAAYGHNSVCEIDGEFFVIAHMRYYDASRTDSANVSLGHNVRVHRLLFNEQGWPVLATERYAGETLGAIYESEIVGSYDLILQDNGTSAAFANSSRYTFKANHQITGAQSGTWSYKANGNYIEITLNGVTYKGVAMPVWTDNGGKIALSAVSDEGRSLWANCVPNSSQPTDPNLDIVKQVDGAAKNTSVAAFDAGDGFTVSFRINNVTDDWKAVVVDINGMSITLPNIDTAFNSVGFPAGNCYPFSAGANQAGYDYDCYMNTNCYVTISISKTNGLLYYKNGVLTQKYLPNAAINGTSTNVQGFIEKLLELIATDGFMFTPNTFAAAGNTTANNTIGSASDLIVSLGAADAQKAMAIYNYYN